MVQISQWESLDQNNFARIVFRAYPSQNRSLLEVACNLCDIFSSRYKALNTDHKACVLGEPTGNIVEVAIPIDMISPDIGVTQIFNLLTMPSEYNYFDTIIAEDIQIPMHELVSYSGPRFGVNGIRNQLGVPTKPLLGAIIKNIDSGLHQSVEQELQKIISHGNIDFFVDDEFQVYPSVDRFRDRVQRISSMLMKDKSTKACYIPNVVGTPSQVNELASVASEAGAVAVSINPIVTGFGTLEDLACSNLNIPIFATNIGAAIFSRHSTKQASSGISENLIAKLSRISGADAMHCGLAGSDWYNESPSRAINSVVAESMGCIRPSFRVIAGGVNIVNLLENWPYRGEDLIFEAGGSIFNHPSGPVSGAYALDLVREIAMEDEKIQDIPIKTLKKARLLKSAERNSVLKEAIELAGWVPETQVMDIIGSV